MSYCSGSACNQMHFLQNLNRFSFLNGDTINIVGLQNLGHVDIRQLNTDGTLDYVNNHARLNVDQFNGGKSSDINIGLQNLCSGSDCNQMHFLQNLRFSFLNNDTINIIGWVI